MSSYPTEPWQEGGPDFCNEAPFPRSNETGFFQPQELAFGSKGIQTGAATPHGQFGANRCEAYLQLCLV